MTIDGVVAAIVSSARDLGYRSLKQEQLLVVVNFLNGNDVFVALTSGYGKSLCCICLQGTFDRLKSVEKTSTVVIISPLVALKKDQVALYLSEEKLERKLESGEKL